MTLHAKDDISILSEKRVLDNTMQVFYGRSPTQPPQLTLSTGCFHLDALSSREYKRA
jgi:hypothetical protein